MPDLLTSIKNLPKFSKTKRDFEKLANNNLDLFLSQVIHSLVSNIVL